MRSSFFGYQANIKLIIGYNFPEVTGDLGGKPYTLINQPLTNGNYWSISPVTEVSYNYELIANTMGNELKCGEIKNLKLKLNQPIF